MLTDYALSAAALYFAARLGDVVPPDRPLAGWLWVLAFAVSGVAALTGGTMHGFRVIMGEARRVMLWNVTVGLIAGGGLLFVAAGTLSGLSTTHPALPWILGGVGVSGLGIALMRARVGLHRHLNHNDIYHLVQIAGFYLLYRGALAVATLATRT